MHKVNLGCGPVFVDSPDWLNLDFSPFSPSVRQANLLDRLPLMDESASLVYSSHFLEHVPYGLVPGLLRECLRVLHPGGVVRLVLPDLENMVREYLAQRLANAHDKADFIVLELIDQCVRRDSGGELGRFYRQTAAIANNGADSMINYIRDRTGEDLFASTVAAKGGRDLHSAIVTLRGRIERAWIRLCLRALPAAFRTQNVSLAAVGERHHWLWDFHQITLALESAGFVEVKRYAADASGVSNFPLHPLDIDTDGRPRKGAESMYVEARKPTFSSTTT